MEVPFHARAVVLFDLPVGQLLGQQLVGQVILGDQDQNADILTANVNGEEKLVVKVKGAGLWGPIWGWVSINKDGQTVYSVRVIVDEMEFAESKNAAGNGGSFNAGSTQDSASNSPMPAPSGAGDGFMNIPDGIDEELPFN